MRSALALLVAGAAANNECLDYHAEECPWLAPGPDWADTYPEAHCDEPGAIKAQTRDVVRYYFIDERLTWDEARVRCPELNPDWEALAVITEDWEWQELIKTMKCATTNRRLTPDYYSGGWVGFSSPDPIPQDGLCSAGVRNPPCKASNWNWVNGVDDRGGPEMSLSTHFGVDAANVSFAGTKWGNPGTGVDGLPQPDNSGGEQRCGLVAFGGILSNAGEPYLSYSPDPFWDDQNCHAYDLIINRNRYICESRGIPSPNPSPPPTPPPPSVAPSPPPPSPPPPSPSPPPPSPSPPSPSPPPPSPPPPPPPPSTPPPMLPEPPPFPPPVPPGCLFWCNEYTCADERCATCNSCLATTPAQCYDWCNVYTCLLGDYCTPCSFCTDLAEGKYCSPWCVLPYTSSFSFCSGCTDTAEPIPPPEPTPAPASL